MSARPRVLLPRPEGSGDALAERLRADGLDVDHHPFLDLAPEHDADIREAVADLAAGRFAWLVLTSPAAIDALDFFDGSEAARGVRFTIPAGTRTAVVGRGTAETLRERGYEPDLVAHGSGASLVAQMPPADTDGPGNRPAVLFPASSAAAPTVPEGLAAAGYAVRREIAYRPVSRSVPPAVVERLRTGGYDAIVLTSSMIARLASALAIALTTKVVTIGEPTTLAAREAGLRVDVQAEEPSTAGLAAAVHRALAP
ncbi:uroporphyrinogen-III synthase [Brachybacterium huguangmaarense]